VGNTLLAALPRQAYKQLVPALEPVTLSLGDIIYASGGHLGYLYFPVTAIVSLVYTMEDGATVEMGLVGKDGVVGIALFMGGETTPNRGIVQIAGSAGSGSAPVPGARKNRMGVSITRQLSVLTSIVRH